MPPKILFSTERQFDLLARAAHATESEGFMADAIALAALDAETKTIMALAVYQNRTTRGTEVHFAAESHKALSRRDVLMGFCAFGFLQLRAPRIIAPIAAWNAPAQIAALKSGFLVTGYLGTGAIDGSDAIIMTLTRNNCRWLPPAMPRPAAPNKSEAMTRPPAEG